MIFGEMFGVNAVPISAFRLYVGCCYIILSGNDASRDGNTANRLGQSTESDHVRWSIETFRNCITSTFTATRYTHEFDRICVFIQMAVQMHGHAD